MASKAKASAGSEVFAQGYLAGAKPNELLKRLDVTYSALKSLEQPEDETPIPGLDNIAAALIEDTILRNKSIVSIMTMFTKHKR
jgi:hypothetical protein